MNAPVRQLRSDLRTLPSRELAKPAVRRIQPGVRDFLGRNAFVVLGLGMAASALTALIRYRIAGDSWYTLLGGRLVTTSGLPQRDTLAVMTAGRSWADQQWLAQASFYELWHVGGWPLALLAVLALYVGAFAVLAVAARSLGASDRSVAVVSLVCFIVGAGNTVLRAQIIGYVLFALVLSLLLLDERAPSRRVLLVFPILAVWANIHGSVLLGAGLVSFRGALFLGTQVRATSRSTGWVRRGGALLLAPWLCVLASPYAIELPAYYKHFLDDPALNSLVTEWAPTDMRNQPLFFVLLFAGLWLVFRNGGRLTLFARIAFLASTVGGLLAVRNTVWCALVGASVLPVALDAAWPMASSLRRRRVDILFATTGLLVALTAAAAVALHSETWFETAYPQAAAKVVMNATRADPQLKVYATEPYADWLLFEDPSLAGRVAYDIRFELLSTNQLSAIAAFHIAAGPDWQRIAGGYGLLVLSPTGDRAPIEILERERGATILYRSRAVVVIRRSTGQS